jgi:hypothetical protein
LKDEGNVESNALFDGYTVLSPHYCYIQIDAESKRQIPIASVQDYKWSFAYNVAPQSEQSSNAKKF